MGRVQLYLDVSIGSGGGGVKPDGTPTVLVDEKYYLDALSKRGTFVVLDPYGESRWAIQCALNDAFGWDGKKDPSPNGLERLRSFAADMTYLPPMMVHRAVVLDHLDDCHRPHPGGDD